MRTQVGIVGAGPAGLALARLLEIEGIDAVVLESRSREHVEQRIRAGVLEQGTVDLLAGAGVGERMQREGLVHHGIELQFAGERHRIPLSDLADGRSIVVYGQTEVVKDLIAARVASGAPLLFEVDEVSVHDLTARTPPTASATRAGTRCSSATSSPAATAFTASAGRASPSKRSRIPLARLPLRLARHPRSGRAVL